MICLSIWIADFRLAPHGKVSARWMRVFGPKSKWAASICVCSPSATRWVQASVYNVNTKNCIAPSETVDEIEQGKEKAVAHAEAPCESSNAEPPCERPSGESFRAAPQSDYPPKQLGQDSRQNVS
jgi:hypothetical protein